MAGQLVSIGQRWSAFNNALTHLKTICRFTQFQSFIRWDNKINNLGDIFWSYSYACHTSHKFGTWLESSGCLDGTGYNRIIWKQCLLGCDHIASHHVQPRVLEFHLPDIQYPGEAKIYEPATEEFQGIYEVVMRHPCRPSFSEEKIYFLSNCNQHVHSISIFIHFKPSWITHILWRGNFAPQAVAKKHQQQMHPCLSDKLRLLFEVTSGSLAALAFHRRNSWLITHHSSLWADAPPSCPSFVSCCANLGSFAFRSPFSWWFSLLVSCYSLDNTAVTIL